jgi:hypothetical protein
MELIPLEPIDAHVFRATLDGYRVTFRQHYQTWAGRWYLDVTCAEVGLDSRGFALVTGRDILANRTLGRMGRLFLLDTAGDEDPTYEGLGTRWVLLYQTRSEVDASA